MPSRKQSSTSKSRSAKKSPNQKSGLSKTTTDHEEIRRWAEERGGRPACVRETGGKGDIGIIRIEFPDAPNSRDDSLEEIEWDEWFDKFDESKLAFLYEEETSAGERSNFNKLVKRETARGAASGR